MEASNYGCKRPPKSRDTDALKLFYCKVVAITRCFHFQRLLFLRIYHKCRIRPRNLRFRPRRQIHCLLFASVLTFFLVVLRLHSYCLLRVVTDSFVNPYAGLYDIPRFDTESQTSRTAAVFLSECLRMSLRTSFVLDITS